MTAQNIKRRYKPYSKYKKARLDTLPDENRLQLWFSKTNMFTWLIIKVFCSFVGFLSLWTKSYDVTIQMKALCLYFHVMLFVCQIFENESWKFGPNLPLATFGSERVKGDCGIVVCKYFFLLKLRSLNKAA